GSQDLKRESALEQRKVFLHSRKNMGIEHYQMQFGNYTNEILEPITLQTVKDYYETFFIPNNIILSVAGNVQKNELRLLLEKIFSRRRRGILPEKIDQSLPMLTMIEEKNWGNLPDLKKPGGKPWLVFNFVFPREHANNFPELSFIFRLLAWAQNSILKQELAIKKKLISLGPIQYNLATNGGLVTMLLKVEEPDKIKEIIASINKIINNLKNIQMSARELEANKKGMIRFFANRYESGITLAANLAIFRTIGTFFNFDKLERYYRSLSSEKVQQTGAKYLQGYKIFIYE
ncbi:M16 family metallopeptidase, partial [Candidatus Riflebacteria bacterium]